MFIVNSDLYEFYDNLACRYTNSIYKKLYYLYIKKTINACQKLKIKLNIIQELVGNVMYPNDESTGILLLSILSNCLE